MSEVTNSVRFVLDGQIVEAQGKRRTTTVLDYLREQLHRTGTKEGCAEGDCGACVVLVGELNAAGSAVEYIPVNSCIQLLPTLDGKSVKTVESLRKGDGSLHPVQQAMVECHGSQCGFCTPGFVMSLYALYENTGSEAPIPSRQAICDSLTGNLCRCTGYRPIIDAGERMFELPSPAGIDRKQLAETLRNLERRDTFSYAPVGTENAPRFYAPRTASAFAAIKAAHPNIRILAGSTDVGLWVTKQFRELGDILYIGQVADLYALEKRDGWIEIGAAVSLEKAYALLAEDYPELTELWLRFASLPIRNAGTLGGNVANGSPIGDSAPALIAIGTRVVLQRGEQRRELPLEDLYLAYQKNAMEEGEFVAGLRIPVREGRDALRFRTYKLSKRFDEDISAVCAALAIELDGEDGNTTVRSARIAYGGMAATSKRATETEAAIIGQPWNEATVRAAMAAMSRDYTPLSDMRATDNYRRVSAANTVYRFWLETRTDAPLTQEQINVRAVELNTLTAAYSAD